MSPEHDLFVTGLAQEAKICEMLRTEIVSGALSRISPQSDLENGLITFRNHITEPLSLAQRHTIRKAIMVRHKHCTPSLHQEIRTGRARRCQCGFGDHVTTFGYRVVSRHLLVIFPSATHRWTYEVDVTNNNFLLILVLRLVRGSFAEPWL